MKTMKKLLALTMALAMVLSLAVTVAAEAPTYTITIPTDDTHTYSVYQIFTGDLSTDGSTLSNLKWGANGKSGTTAGAELTDTELTELENAIKNIAADASNKDKYDAIKGFADLSGNAFGTASKDAPLIVPAGYYLLKDSADLGEDDAYTSYIIQVVQNETIKRKADTPKVEKYVKDINDTEDTAAGAWAKSADHDIGDTIEFMLTGTVPKFTSDYANYVYNFEDTLAAGLTYKADSAKVYLYDTDPATASDAGTEITTGFTVAEANGVLTVSCADLNDIAGIAADKYIAVKYSATLDTVAEGTVIGSAGNVNSVTLEYSTKPDVLGETATTKTAAQTVTVYTYETVLSKVDENDAILDGADFTIEKKLQDGTWKNLTVVEDTTKATFTVTGMDDGIYKITETTTPDGYNSIDPIYIKVTSNHSTGAALDVQVVDEDGEAIAEPKFTFVANATTGQITTDIVNKSGIELPETGGIGTTIFYVVGGLLVIGAVVLLVTKKKMTNEDK